MKVKSNVNAQVTHRFDSPAEYLALCEGDPKGGASHEDGRSYFYGPESWDQARVLARDGWAAGREKVHALTGSFVSALSGRIMQEDWIHNVTGAAIDVAEYVQGVPECWLEPQEIEGIGTVRRHVSILYNGTVSGGVAAETIEKRGAAIAALADLLELAGNAVTIEVVFANRDRNAGDGMADFVTVKRSNERLNLDVVMFWLAHPAALRRMAFARWEGLDKATRERYHFYKMEGYGACAEPIVDSEPDVYFESGDLYGGPMWADPEKVKEWIENKLTELGVALTPAP